MNILHQYAKQLRKNSTDTERLLWSRLRNKRFEGLKFRRQEPIGKYIVDFICYEKKYVIECDGSQHLASVLRTFSGYLRGAGDHIQADPPRIHLDIPSYLEAF